MPVVFAMSVYWMHIGHLVKNRRLDLGSTQQELEDRSGVTQSMISKLEKGTAHNISVEAQRKLAKALVAV